MITVVDHPDQCRALWLRLVPPEGLFDLWDVRSCFQEHYGYRSRFLVAEDGSGPTGLLALSEIADHGYWGFFPGETYHGKTWLEQNRILAATPDDRLELLAHCPDPAHLRYVSGQYAADGTGAEVDEVNYLFRPAEYGCSFEQYLQAFSGKSRKRLRRELDELEARGVSYRYDDPSDIDRAFAMNLELFGDRSYFADERFLSSFRGLCHMLRRRGWLRVTALLLGGRIAAVDVGAVYRGVYTVLGGGTDASVAGVAKLINFHHIQWACQQRLDTLDFLCGDFGWKERFHLTARPMYQIRKGCADMASPADRAGTRVDVA